jgi:hypothetical protein
MCTLDNRTYHSMEFIIMCRAKNRPKSPIVTREVRDKDDESKLFPNFVQYSRTVYSFYHVYERLTVIVMQCFRSNVTQVLRQVKLRLREGKTTTLNSVQHRCNMIRDTWYFLVHGKTHTDDGTTF